MTRPESGTGLVTNKTGVQRFSGFLNSQNFNVLMVLLILVIASSIISPSFLKPGNVINVIRQISINGIIAIGMTFILLTGGIDLSVGAIVGIVAVTVANMFSHGIGPGLAIPAALTLGLLIGLINGLGITQGRINPFIMTLGTMTAFRGLSLLLANGAPISWRKAGISFKELGQGSFLFIPTPVFLFFGVFLLAFIILKYTYFGRSLYAIGDSRETARLSGINVIRTEILVYMVSGFLAALSCLVLLSRLSVGEPTAGEGYELDAIAMSVIGGTSATGGVGGVVGTLIGASLLSVLNNLLNLMGISPFVQKIVKGAIIIFSVFLDSKRIKK